MSLVSRPETRSVGPTGAALVTASFWGAATAEAWFEELGLGAEAAGPGEEAGRVHREQLAEQVLKLDLARTFALCHIISHHSTIVL